VINQKYKFIVAPELYVLWKLGDSPPFHTHTYEYSLHARARTHTHTHTHTHIYIYIYIYTHIFSRALLGLRSPLQLVISHSVESPQARNDRYTGPIDTSTHDILTIHSNEHYIFYTSKCHMHRTAVVVPRKAASPQIIRSFYIIQPLSCHRWKN
jgi:hypothetical protein